MQGGFFIVEVDLILQGILCFIIFALLLAGMFLLFKINPFRRKQSISISKQALSEKIKNIDERFGRLSFKDKIITSIRNVAAMNGININLDKYLYHIKSILTNKKTIMLIAITINKKLVPQRLCNRENCLTFSVDIGLPDS